MDIDALKKNIVTNLYHIDSSKKVPLHRHPRMDEIFYCMAGSGYGVLEHSEQELTVGKAFIVPAGTLHSLRSDGDLYVASFLVPIAGEQ